MRPTRKTNALLWTVQLLLALLFLFAGVMKLISPLAELERQSGGMSGLFLKLIGLAEALGAVGLIAPGLAKIGRTLTPLAAAGLLIIMVGAVMLTVQGGAVAPALVPLVVGALCALVAYGRWRVQPVAS
ncbi:MAG TPA: DoxX family protein [Myxococcales bacterium]|nr:DoxX family protein [Myxococcales bacterium]